MKRSLPLILLLVSCLISFIPVVCNAQADFTRYGVPVKPALTDSSIEKAIGTIAPSRIQQTIERLVSFGNRNSLSSMEPNLPGGTGIEAAAE